MANKTNTRHCTQNEQHKGLSFVLIVLVVTIAQCGKAQQTGKQQPVDTQAAPFISIRDGKASARRIQQQQSPAKSPKTETRDLLGQNDNKRGKSELEQTTEEVFNQKNTFNLSSDDFMSTSTFAPTNRGETNEVSQQQVVTSDPSGESGKPSIRLLVNQQQQQLATPNSMSMSLDGMLVNSRPRSSEQQVSTVDKETKKKKTKSKSVAPTSRIGEFEPATSGRVLNAKPNSRRVPFTGVPFSSPATKGQRTRAKASNQVGAFEASGIGSQQQQQAARIQLGLNNNLDDTTQINNLMQANLQLGNDGSSQMNSNRLHLRGMKQAHVTSSGNDATSFNTPIIQHNIDAQLAQGFDDEQQQFQQQQRITAANNENSLDTNGQLAYMRSLIAQSAVTNQDKPLGSSSDNSNSNNNDGDMLMSWVTSADGKERRLVMIARDTLDSLQRFAAVQNENQRQVNLIANQQAAISQQDISTTSSWWPETSSQLNVGWTPSSTATPTDSVRGQPEISTTIDSRLFSSSGPNLLMQQQQNEQVDQQQEVQLQTTTTPPSLSSATSSLTTSTGQQVGSVTTTTAAPQLETSTSLFSANNSSSQSRLQESFREIPVSSTQTSLRETNQQKQVVSTSKAKSQQATKGGKKTAGSKSGGQNAGSKKTAGQSGGSLASSGLTAGKTKLSNGTFNATGDGVKSGGKRKNNGISLNSGISEQQQQQKGKTTANMRKATSGQSQGSSQRKQQGKVSNGQQKQQSSRVFDEQSSTTTEMTAAQRRLNSSLLTSISDEPASRTTTAISTTASSSAQSADSNLNQVANQSRQQVQTTTIMSLESGGQREGSKQLLDSTESNKSSAANDQRPTANVRVATSSNGPGRGSSSSRLTPLDINLERQLDELERAQENPQATNGGDQGEQRQGELSMTTEDRLASLRDAIPGEPLVDYPIYGSPPKTNFNCMSQSCPGGYYADLETQCQVFHICQSDGRFDTFLCPNGTIFSQQHFVCVWWWQVDCSSSASFYKLNDGIYCNSANFPTSSSASLTLNRSNQQLDSSSLLRTPSNGTQLVLSLNNATRIDENMNEDANGISSTSTTSSSSSSSSTINQQNGNFEEISSTGNGISTTQSSSRQQQQTNLLSLNSDGSTESDLNQQQQQQLELLSRKA